MCCNCCPPTINALFCLWFQSGCSKDSVAGALTFFPPDPPLYKFERYSPNGESINKELNGVDRNVAADGDSEGALKEDSVNVNDGSINNNEEKQFENEKSNSSGRKPTQSMISPSAHTMSRGVEEDQKDDDYDPMVSLADRAKLLRQRAKIKNEQDAYDAANNISYVFVPDPRLAQPPSFSGHLHAIKIGPHRSTKSYVAAHIYQIRSDKRTDKTKTIIYSHGNATDIGAMYFMQVVMAKGLQCNVIMYDYSGYGESGGLALEPNTYNDITMVYDYALSNVVQNGDEKQIIIYGQSVGSGPSCYICSKRPGVGGLILHSPFMSGMRVLTPSRALACLDIFPNINRIKNVRCPVMIIHGLLDEEVHISHGKALYDAVPDEFKRNPWWVRDRGHNDITEGRAKLIEYIQRLKTFLESLDRS